MIGKKKKIKIEDKLNVSSKALTQTDGPPLFFNSASFSRRSKRWEGMEEVFVPTSLT